MKPCLFSALELICLASIQKKKEIYGIPDVYSLIPEERRGVAVQEIKESLRVKGYVIMDVDGNYTLSPEAQEVMAYSTECESCLVVARKPEAGTTKEEVFWKKGNTYLWGEPDEEGIYTIAPVEKSDIEALLGGVMIYGNVNAKKVVDWTVPQIALKKARRRCSDGRPADALRILRQYGMDEETSKVLCEALSEQAAFYLLMRVDISREGNKTIKYTIVQLHDLMLELSSTVEGRQSALRFVSVSPERAKERQNALLVPFFGKETGGRKKWTARLLH